VECEIAGATLDKATARLLRHADLNAHNSFDKPDNIMPVAHAVRKQGTSKLLLTLPPLSVVTVQATLG